MVSVEKVRYAARFINDKIENLFEAEISNERDGGVSPSTLFSTIDSVRQAPEIMCPDWEPSDWAALLWITAVAGRKAEVRDLLRLREQD